MFQYRRIRRASLEVMILDGLRHQLMAPELVKEFASTFIQEVTRQQREKDQGMVLERRQFAEVTRQLDLLVDAIANGLRGAALQSKLNDLERRKAGLQQEIAGANATLPRLHPKLAEIYRSQVARLHETIAHESTRDEAIELLRGLIDRVLLHPGNGGPEIELIGEIGGMVELGMHKDSNAARERAAVSEVFRSSVKVVAGKRNQLYRTRIVALSRR